MAMASENESRAVFLNFKEVRFLEKNKQVLDLEKAYSVRILNMHRKDMQVHYKKLKDRFTRIRSHLTHEEIDEMKMMEASGEIKLRSIPATDSDIRIAAAAKRLKLQPRAKSAMPRLSRGHDTERSCTTRPIRATHSAFVRSTSVASEMRSSIPRCKSPRNGSKSARDENGQCSRVCSPKSSPRRSICPETVTTPSDFPLPRSVREDRRTSIFSNQSATNGIEKPVIKISQPESDDTASVKSFRSTKSVNSNSNERPFSPRVSPTSSKSITKPLKDSGNISIDHTPKSATAPKSDTKTWADKTNTYLKLPLHDGINDNDQSDVNNDDGITAATLVVPQWAKGGQASSEPLESARSSSGGGRIKSSRLSEMAERMRRKSIADVQRASKLIAEGKTRVPFDSHDYTAIAERAKAEKPFRPIREKTHSVNLETESISDCMGDELYKDMKKGMILGEIASTLCLEDAIDSYMDRVEDYIRENPNYTYDPEKSRAEMEAVRAQRRAEKLKKPKSKIIRRQQLER